MKPQCTLRSECFLLLFFLLALCTLFAGCSGESSPTPQPSPITVSISPAVVRVFQGVTTSFVATVTGTTNIATSWSVKEGAAGGSITSAGVYTAPTTGGTFHVVATSKADPTKSATAAVTVPLVRVLMTCCAPASILVDTGLQFGVEVTGTNNQAVIWSVREGAAGGTINQSGWYTAPNVPGEYTVVATSQADPTVYASAGIKVVPPVVRITPQSETVGPEGTRQFAAYVETEKDQSVTWSVQEGSAGGNVSADGLYTAPAAQGVYHLIATSIADKTISGTAAVTVGPHGFRPVVPLLEARANPTATLLQDGRVLIAGGCDNPCDSSGNGTLASAELFDPITNSFNAAGSMTDARLGHTATLLPDGRVLLVGGSDATGHATNSADLYDPNNGTFTPTGNLKTSRAWHTASLLPDGRVLIAGGITGFGDSDQDVLTSAEVYDPQSGAFTMTGNMTTPRWRHAAAVLDDGSGMVLVAGGFLNVNYLATASAEIFDPATGEFSSTGSMGNPRGDFTMTSDGEIFASGGVDATEVFGVPGEVLYSSVEMYQPQHGFQLTMYMAYSRYLHSTVVLPDGTVLVVGGISDILHGELAAAEIDDPHDVMSSGWQSTGSLQFGADSQAAVLLQDGRVLVVGGFDRNGTPVDLAETYQ